MKLVLVCSSSVFTNIDCINFCCLHLFVTLLAELCICLGNLYHSVCSMLYSYFSIMWSLVCCTAASEVTFWATKWLFSATVVRFFLLLGMLEQARWALGGILFSLVRTKTQVQGQLILTRVQGKTRGMWPPVMNGPPVLKKAKEWCPIKWQSRRGAVNLWCYLSAFTTWRNTAHPNQVPDFRSNLYFWVCKTWQSGSFKTCSRNTWF